MFGLFKKKKTDAPEVKSKGQKKRERSRHNRAKHSRPEEGQASSHNRNGRGGRPMQREKAVVLPVNAPKQILTQMNLDVNDAGVYFGALGGMEEIGCNLYLYGTGGDWIIVDLGIGFADERISGADKLIPDISFLKAIKGRILGILLTHSHYDHFAAIADVWNEIRCPIYGMPFALEMCKNMFGEYGLLGKVPLNAISEEGRRFTLGAFDIEFMHCTHSTLQSNFIILRTPQGTMIHTGDFTFDPTPLIDEPTDMDKLAELGREGVAALMCDSTNALFDRPKLSEADAAAELERVIGGIKSGKIVCTCFSTSIVRVQTISRIAEKLGRRLVICGRSLESNIACAKNVGYLRELDYIGAEDAAKMGEDKVLYLCTGTQGEPRSTISRIAAETYNSLQVGEGDTVLFSSRIIPGREKSIFAIQNAFARRGVNIISILTHPKIHASGHAYAGEIELLFRTLMPRVVVPIHGEPMHIAATGQIAWRCGLKEQTLRNGEFVVFDGELGGLPRIVESVQTGEVAIDGKRKLSPDSDEFSNRSKMGNNGVLFVSLTLSKNGLVGKPEVSSFGLFESDETGLIKSQISKSIKDGVSKLAAKEFARDGSVKDAISSAVAKAVRSNLDKKPMVEIHIGRIN
ncbi:MAG: ribonuclease J [Rickettsiales bacterium]|jgi:ribonuclease J|nr:ribonuclease J [Rickettsiales bacterium]